jgi:hypothetical protein
MTDTPAAAPADPWSMTTDQISSLTPDQATAALAAMDRAIHPPPSVVPQDAQDARATLDLLSRDASFARELFSGSIEARKRFDELVAKSAAGDDVGDAVAGIVEPGTPLFSTTVDGQLPRSHVEGAIAGLRDAGLNDASIEQAVNLPPISRAEFMQAQALKSQLYGTGPGTMRRRASSTWFQCCAPAQSRRNSQMKYVCTFMPPKTCERREVIVDVPPGEIAGLEERRELIGEAYALQRAYRDVPFLHEQVERVALH